MMKMLKKKKKVLIALHSLRRVKGLRKTPQDDLDEMRALIEPWFRVH